ncbi:hypothetical protein VTO42DRAFT_4417 [Malbranchea cinnamomea]
MEEYPPPYEMATARDVWAIVAPYIPSADLCAACLVSRKWHQMFVPFLWGSPASHFGSDNDAMYVALTRFRRTLTHCRLWVRSLTHTFHLPPALTEIYGGPRSTWLLEVLEHLPNLQSLLVARLPFFDHSALTALSGERGPTTPRTYGLRLLLAREEPNTTSFGLAQALMHFPKLVYLDLSYTTPARSVSVLSVLSQLPDLQVLKLRGVGLRDPEVEVLANAIGTRVRLLDLRNNHLTDSALRSLLQACFLAPEDVACTGAVPCCRPSRFELSWPATTTSNVFSPDSLRSEHLDKHLLAQLTRPLTGRCDLEDLPHVGVTHLYIADNNISVEGLTSVLNTSRLHVLDGGTVDTAEAIRRRQHSLSVSIGGENNFVTRVRFPGAEKLIPVLGKAAAENLTYLRVHHAVVTENAPGRDSMSPKTLLPELPTESQHAELETPLQQPAELDATSNQIHELSGGMDHVCELADTSLSLSAAPAAEAKVMVSLRETGQTTSTCTTIRTPNAEGDRAKNGTTTIVERNELVAGSSGTRRRAIPLLREPSDADLPEAIPSPVPPPSPSQVRAEKISQLLAKRPRNLMLPHRNRDDSDFPYLHPSYLPHLRTIVLTDVPSSVPASSPILKALIRFITECSNEALLATLQARSDYSLPPGIARARAELEHAKSLFALERVVLEVTPVRKSKLYTGPSTWTPQGYYNPGVSRSSTGDVDSENLWAAAVNDFSFFSGEECGIPDNEPGRHFPLSALNEKIALVPPDTPRTNLESAPSLPIAELESPGTTTTTTTTTTGGDQVRRPAPNTMMARNTPARRSPAASGAGPHARNPQHRGSDAAPQPEPDVDLVQALASFRKAKRQEYEELVGRASRLRRVAETAADRAESPLGPSVSSSGGNASTIPLHVEGHWKGEVQIVRNPIPTARSGVVDVYGNFFEKGYLYP